MAKQTLASQQLERAAKRLAEIEAKRTGFKIPPARGDVINTSIQSRRKEGKGKGAKTGGGKSTKKPKGKKAPAWVDPDKKNGKTPKAKDETKDDLTFVDDFGDTDTGSDDYTFIDDFGDTDTGTGSDDWTFVDDFGDTGTGSDDWTFLDDSGDTDWDDSGGSSWSWDDTGWKHGGRIKKAKKAKAEARKPRSRPAIRGRRRELKGS